jgi:hypothetical protein
MNGITKVCTKSAVLPRKTPAGWIEMNGLVGRLAGNASQV